MTCKTIVLMRGDEDFKSNINLSYKQKELINQPSNPSINLSAENDLGGKLSWGGIVKKGE